MAIRKGLQLRNLADNSADKVHLIVIINSSMEKIYKSSM